MEQPTQPTPTPAAPATPTAPAATVPPVVNQPVATPQVPAPAKSTPVWVWLLGGCLGIILITMLAIGGLTWWAARKVKQEFKNAQPKLEQWQKDAEKMSQEASEWQKESDKWQAEMEKIRNQIPEVPEDYDTSLE